MGHDADMPEPRDAVDRTLDDLVADVTARLELSGWQVLSLRNHALASFVRATHDGIIATVDLLRTSYSSRGTLPVNVVVSNGVGFRPALDLMPLLTLPADASLLPQRDNGSPFGLRLTLSTADDVAPAVAQIVALVEGRALAYANGFADVDAIDAALRAYEPDEEVGVGSLTMARLTLLTSAGRHTEARSLLATFTPTDRADRRFQRQLLRWLDAGRTAIPPVEETLALLPPPEPPRPRPSWAASKAKTELKKQATDSVRAQARGKSVDELTTMLATAYAQRDLDVSSVNVATMAAAIELQQQPFGKVRSALRSMKLLASVGTDVVGRIRDGSVEDPPWMQLPERANFPLERGIDRKATVIIDAAATDVVARVFAEAPERYGFVVRVDVWFDADADAGLAVHIGDQRIGTVPPADAMAFGPILRAAAIFDEAPFVRAQLIGIDGTPVTLRVPVPTGAS
jgi:hypothetical protein